MIRDIHTGPRSIGDTTAGLSDLFAFTSPKNRRALSSPRRRSKWPSPRR